MVVEPIFEREFAQHSYGCRPGRGCKEALRRVDELLQSGLVHVVDVDIKGCFDSISHERLMVLVRERIADGRMLALIESYLKQGIMSSMGEIDAKEHDEGTPQGGVNCFGPPHGPHPSAALQGSLRLAVSLRSAVRYWRTATSTQRII